MEILGTYFKIKLYFLRIKILGTYFKIKLYFLRMEILYFKMEI